MEIQGIPHDKLLSVQDVATITGLTCQAIYKFTSARSIPFLKVGRTIRFDGQEILDWLEGKKVTTIKKGAATPARV